MAIDLGGQIVRPSSARSMKKAGPSSAPEKSSIGMLTQTLCVVVSASNAQAIAVIMRRTVMIQHTILMRSSWAAGPHAFSEV